MLERLHGCMHDQFCIKFPNHHCCMCVMEIIWDIPFILEPLAKPTPWHTSCLAVLKAIWVKTSNHHKPWPRMRILIPVLGRRNNGVSQENRVIHHWAANTLPKEKEVPDQRSEENKRKKNKILDQRSEENKRKKKQNSRSKIGRKQKKIYRKVFGPDSMWTNIQNCHKQIRKERKPWLEVVLSLWLPTKILCAGEFLTPH